VPNVALLWFDAHRELRTATEANVHEADKPTLVQKNSFFFQVQCFGADICSLRKNSAKHFAKHKVNT
jgi:hypothetical protein